MVYSFKSVLTELILPAQDQYPPYQPLTMIISSKPRFFLTFLQIQAYSDVENAFKHEFTAVFITGNDSNKDIVLQEAA